MKTKLGKYVPFLPILALLYFFMQMGSAEAQNTDGNKTMQNVATHKNAVN